MQIFQALLQHCLLVPLFTDFSMEHLKHFLVLVVPRVESLLASLLHYSDEYLKYFSPLGVLIVRTGTFPSFIPAIYYPLETIVSLHYCPRSLSLQGLFHPARKVREAYWKIYNTLYIGSQVS